MGMCLPCLGGPGNDLSTTPDRETRRLELAEAAEKRQKETTYRGVKNPQAVERNKKNKEMEKQEMRPSPPGGEGGGGGMKVSPHIFNTDYVMSQSACNFRSGR
ncbi:small VCP/p97-interacting protein-like isoform X1 [Salvelinus fontinalis]|uniref:small VCP/p97-interacting protein-like isoform X1 n=1 Tax=Salvelinus fontinalis TaxID=8038 RepID=UPI002484E187|nr:small VCP/p97-interacting protein-like isoform X1 [Salvelinus fontinalis]XP_055789142.1 small VCP/p97-interacting protein-like isoform X1 [Salvelinus fontinalis]